MAKNYASALRQAARVYGSMAAMALVLRYGNLAGLERRTRGLLLSACFALGASGAVAQTGVARYVLDPEHTTVGFLVTHAGYASVLGQFETVAGEYRFDEAAGELVGLDVTVKTASVQTHHAARDRHLRSADFLNTERFPDLHFSAMGARRTGERSFVIEGELTLLGRTQPLALEATWNKSAAYPFGNSYVMGVSARGRFRRSAFGMDYGVANSLVGDEVEMLIEIEARRE